jgi:hypothetical protein
VSFFRLRQALAETLQCISQTPVLVALSFAIVPKYWRPSADHVWASEVGKGFVSDPQQSGPSLSSPPRSEPTLFASTWRSDR